MRPGGCILNIGWDHATIDGMAGDDPELFAAVKAGVLGFSKSFARSVAPDVRVNVLCPGWIETAYGAGADRAFYDRGRGEHAAAAAGAGRRTSRAPRCGWLRRRAAFVTGQAINVNGGDGWLTRCSSPAAWPSRRCAASCPGLEIDHQIAVMNISVAALMTTRWIAKRLRRPTGWTTS